MRARQRRGIQWNALLEFHGHTASFTAATKSGVCGLHRDGGTAGGGREEDINGENRAQSQTLVLQWRRE